MKTYPKDYSNCSKPSPYLSTNLLPGNLATLERLERSLQGDSEIVLPELSRLAGYYDHLAELAKGYEKNADKLAENLRHVYRWRDEVTELEASLK
jgi:hypothetical protein